MSKNHDPGSLIARISRNGRAILLVLGLIFLAVGAVSIFVTLQDFGNIGQDVSQGFTMIQNVFHNQILALVSVFGGALLMLGGATHAKTESGLLSLKDSAKQELQKLVSAQEKTESGLLSLKDSVEEEVKKLISVKELSTADEIWDTCTSMLTRLSTKGWKDRHAYDVTTYFNRIHYEEMVAKCISQGVEFKRVFCFRDQKKESSDHLMEWYLRCIETGHRVTLDEINKQSFESDLLLAFKERDLDDIAIDFTPAHVERLNKIIQTQSKAKRTTHCLAIKAVPNRMPMDFVVMDYDREGAGSPECEVQSNFKTAPASETYVAGTYGTGVFARHYQQLFVKMIYEGEV